MHAIPTRAITSGPNFHWFGYYDKLQFSPSNRYVLGMEVGFEGRQPEKGDEIALGLIDTEGGDDWRQIGSTTAWCWQQGCMLQWIPGSDTKVIWNERANDGYASRILDIETMESRLLPEAIYTIAPDGKRAIGTDFRRIDHMRPGYGYAGALDPNFEKPAPDDSGIYTIDFLTGESHQIISIAEVASLPYRHGDLAGAKHYFNHLLYNTDGSRFIFLHRWRFGDEGFQTRMMTANADGSGLHIVDDSGKMSHFIWRDPETITAWSWQPSHGDSFYIYRDQTDEVSVIAPEKMPLNGHNTYLADTDWILNDCYPQGGKRTQDLYLYHVPTDRRIDIGSFYSPAEYVGEWRCDLHPRSSRDGRLVTIDSTHTGAGRQIFLIDVGEVIDSHGGKSAG
jgi:hypothetical protein